ncbi:MAG: hypothetical protein KAJ93_00715 [Methanosarcinales archaeon]|nr:hypothetical protein [Methanosarcinales archaeon]
MKRCNIGDKILIINLIKKNGFILHRFIIKFMYMILYINITYYFFLFIYQFLKFLLEYFFNDDINVQKHWFIILFIFIFILSIYLFFYLKLPHQISLVELKNVKDIPPYTKYLEYYDPLLYIFLINLIFLFCIPLSFSDNDLLLTEIVLLIGHILLIFYLIVFIILTTLKYKYDNNLYYTLNRANYILNDYIIKNDKEDFIILEFNKYFKKSLDIIDNHLPDNIKINKLKVDNNESIKNALIHYLTIYIKYGNPNHIKSLSDHLNRMLKLTHKKNGIVSLEITQIILNIHNDIDFFLKSYNYPIIKQHWDIKLLPFWIQHLSRYIPYIQMICIIIIIIILMYIIPIIKSTPISTAIISAVIISIAQLIKYLVFKFIIKPSL